MNEVEKKEIEEMAKVLPDTLPDLFNKNIKIILGKSFKKQIAREYYIAGYGKVEDYKKEIARLKDVVMFGKCINCKIFEEMEQKLKQRAIKEFAKRLSDKFYKLNENPYDTLHNFEIDDLVNAEIDILLKEYGIGETK